MFNGDKSSPLKVHCIHKSDARNFYLQKAVKLSFFDEKKFLLSKSTTNFQKCKINDKKKLNKFLKNEIGKELFLQYFFLLRLNFLLLLISVLIPFTSRK